MAARATTAATTGEQRPRRRATASRSASSLAPTSAAARSDVPNLHRQACHPDRRDRRVGSRNVRPDQTGTIRVSRPASRRRPAAAVVRPSRRCRADLMTTVDVTLKPFERRLGPDGVALALPEGYVRLVHPRSGLSRPARPVDRQCSGTIDAGSRGEITVCLVNLDPRRRSARPATGSPSGRERHKRPRSSRWTRFRVGPRHGGLRSTEGFRDQAEAPHDAEES